MKSVVNGNELPKSLDQSYLKSAMTFLGISFKLANLFFQSVNILYSDSAILVLVDFFVFSKKVINGKSKD